MSDRKHVAARISLLAAFAMFAIGPPARSYAETAAGTSDTHIHSVRSDFQDVYNVTSKFLSLYDGGAGHQFSITNPQTLASDGDIALGPGAKQNFSDGLVKGKYWVDTTANNTHSNNVVFQGGTVVKNLSAAQAAIVQASLDVSALFAATPALPVLSLAAITTSKTVDADDAGGTLHLIKVNGDVHLSAGALTLNGNANDFFVVDVTGVVSLSGGSQIALTGGLRTDHVLFNILGTGQSGGSGNSVLNGTYLVPNGKVQLNGNFLNGALYVTGGDLAVTSAAVVKSAPFVPEPPYDQLFVLLGMGGIGLLWRRSAAKVAPTEGRQPAAQFVPIR